MGSQIAILQKDKEELANEVVITKATVSVLRVLYMYIQCTDVHIVHVHLYSSWSGIEPTCVHVVAVLDHLYMYIGVLQFLS